LEGCIPFAWESGSSVDHPVLSDAFLLMKRWDILLPRNCLGSEDMLLEEALLDDLFQIFSEGSLMDGLVPLTVAERAVLLRPRQ